jgi:endogenous inhibitor of DNA gyrase (YacG/DUF329 family)
MIQPILCPICQKPATDLSKTPFCTERCRKIDFFRWWDGRYAITQPVEIAFDPENEEAFQSPDEEGYMTNDSL